MAELRQLVERQYVVEKPVETKGQDAPVGWKYWLLWVLVSSGAAVSMLAIVAILGFEVALTASEEGIERADAARELVTNGRYVSIIASASAFAGFFTGLLQGLFLKRLDVRIGWWVLASTIGFAVAGPVGLFAGYLVHAVAGYALIGVSIGLAQWFALRTKVSNAGWWLPANVAFVIPILGAAITGWTLIWLVRQSPSTLGE